jgi:hypothetical protein
MEINTVSFESTLNSDAHGSESLIAYYIRYDHS